MFLKVHIITLTPCKKIASACFTMRLLFVKMYLIFCKELSKRGLDLSLFPNFNQKDVIYPGNISNNSRSLPVRNKDRAILIIKLTEVVL